MSFNGFSRKPSLGDYSGTRVEWREAYQLARMNLRFGIRPNPKSSKLNWKAQLIVWYERGDLCDPLNMPLSSRLLAMKMVAEILETRSEKMTISEAIYKSIDSICLAAVVIAFIYFWFRNER